MRTPLASLVRLPKSIWALGVVSLLMDVSSEMVHSLLPLFLVSIGTSTLMVGLIEGAAEATALIVKVFAGVISDWLGRRKLLATVGYALGAASKPLFALAGSADLVLGARLIDRVGKGVRGAPRDALVADIAPKELRGAAFGLRQSLDTVGALLGPALAVALMFAWNDDFRAVFWVALIPGVLAVLVLLLGVVEPAVDRPKTRNPLALANLKRLDRAYFRVVVLGALFSLARFSEAFLVLRAQSVGVALALVPLVMVGMNLAYSLSAYPFGALSDRMSHARLLRLGIVVLIAADLVLASSAHWLTLLLGVLLWGLHMGITQGLLASMVASTAPADLRGTAFGLFSLMSGVAVLVASVVAGFMWDRFGPAVTFYAGAAFCGLALLASLRAQRPQHV